VVMPWRMASLWAEEALGRW